MYFRVLMLTAVNRCLGLGSSDSDILWTPTAMIRVQGSWVGGLGLEAYYLG